MLFRSSHACIKSNLDKKALGSLPSCKSNFTDYQTSSFSFMVPIMPANDVLVYSPYSIIYLMSQKVVWTTCTTGPGNTQLFKAISEWDISKGVNSILSCETLFPVSVAFTPSTLPSKQRAQALIPRSRQARVGTYTQEVKSINLNFS